MVHIGLNAHLLSGKKGYRSAGIHGYIYNTLANLPAAAPPDWRFTAMVGRGNPNVFRGITTRHAPFNTEHPAARVLWEQAVQPWRLGDFDLLHAMAFVSPVLTNKPGVVTVYDLSFLHYPDVLSAARRHYLRALTAVSCRRAERVIVISHSTARDLRDSFDLPAEKVDVAAPGYDRSAYRPLPEDQVAAFRVRMGLPPRFWLFLGTLEPRKNLVTLLDAYASLGPHERLPLVLAGGKGWDYDPIFERISRYELEDVVFTPGFLPAADLPLWYNSAELFVYPSVFEGFGLPVLEAMACGTPVLVSDASSLPEVVGDNTLCLPPQDSDAWAQALQHAFYDADWRQATSTAGLQSAARYSWEETARATVASYQRALEHS